jgi:hypothetical protein
MRKISAAILACATVAAGILGTVTAYAVPVNAFDEPGYQCYAQGTTVFCDAPGRPTIVKLVALTPKTCPFYARLIAEGRLAAEVAYDPASPCQKDVDAPQGVTFWTY